MWIPRASGALGLVVTLFALVSAPCGASEAATEKSASRLTASSHTAAALVPLELLAPVKDVFGALASATKLTTTGNTLLTNFPLVGSTVDGLLGYLATSVLPDAGADMFKASPVVRELARRTIADLLGAVLLSVLVLIEALSAPFAAPVAPFVLAHSVMQTVSLSSAAAVGLRRLRHIQHAEVVQRRVCTTVLDAWWAKREADEELGEAIERLANDEEEAEVFGDLQTKVDDLLLSAREATTEVTDMWKAWQSDTTGTFDESDKSAVAVAYRFVERVSSFAEWWKARLSNKLTKATWMRVANAIGDADQERTREHAEAGPGSSQDRLTKAADETAAEVGVQSSLYNAAKADVTLRVADALDIVRTVQERDADELFPGDHGDAGFFGSLCVSVVETSTLQSLRGNTAQFTTKCGEAAFVVDKARKAVDGFQLFIAPDTTLNPASDSATTPSATATTTPPNSASTLQQQRSLGLRRRKVKSQLKCLLLQGDIGESLMDGSTAFQPIRFHARPRPALGAGSTDCDAFHHANPLIGTPVEYSSATMFSFGLRRKLLLLANLPANFVPSDPVLRDMDRTRVTSISLVAEYFDTNANCHSVETLGRISLPESEMSTGDLAPLFQLMVEQIQYFVVDTTALAATTRGTQTAHKAEVNGKIPPDASWADIDGFFTFGPFTPSPDMDPAFTAIAWSSEHSKRCWQDARNQAIKSMGFSMGVEELSSSRGLGMCHDSIREDFLSRFNRLREISDKAIAVKKLLENNMHIHDAVALQELESLDTMADPAQVGIEMTDLGSLRKRRALASEEARKVEMGLAPGGHNAGATELK